MLSFLGRFARGVFRYFSTSLEEFTQSTIDFFVREHSKPTIGAQASARSKKATKQSPNSAENPIRSSKTSPTCQVDVFSISPIVQLPLPEMDMPISLLGSTFNSGRLSIDGLLKTSYFVENSLDTSLPQPEMSFAVNNSVFVCLASFMCVCLIFGLGCFRLRKQTSANDYITVFICTEAKSMNYAFFPSLSSFDSKARLPNLPNAEDEEISTSSASPTMSFSPISNLAAYSPEANEDQSEAEEPVLCEDAGNKCHPCRACHGQYHHICQAQDVKHEDSPQKVIVQVTVDEEQVKEALQQVLAPLKDELIKERDRSSLSNPEITKFLVEGLRRALMNEPAIGDLVYDVRQLSEDMKAVKKYTGAGEEQDYALQRLSKGSLCGQLDDVDKKITQLPTCCVWATELNRDVGPMSLKLRRDLNMYGRRGSAGRKVPNLPRDLDILEARVDTMLSHRCGESKQRSSAEAQPSDSSSNSKRSHDSNAAQHGSSSKAKELPRPSPQPAPEFLPEPLVKCALQSASWSATQPQAQSGPQTKISPVAEPEKAEANITRTAQQSVAATDATTSDQLACRHASETKLTDTESQLVKSLERFRQKYIDMLQNLLSRAEQLSTVPGSKFEAAADYLGQEILSHLETLQEFRVTSLRFQVLVEPMGPIVILLEQKFEELKESIAKEPTTKEPIAQEPIAQEPIAQEPIVKRPIVKEPIVTEPVMKNPIAKDPIEKELRHNEGVRHDSPPPGPGDKDDGDNDWGCDYPGSRADKVSPSPSNQAKARASKNRKASGTNSASKSTIVATEEQKDVITNENEPQEPPGFVPKEDELKAKESKVPATLVEHNDVLRIEDPAMSTQDNTHSEISSVEAVGQPEGGSNEMEVEDEGYNPTNAWAIPQGPVPGPPTNIGNASDTPDRALLASVLPPLQLNHQEPVQTNTVLPQDAEMSDNPPASQPVPSANNNFTPFFGAEGLDDMDVDLAPTNNLPSLWQDPAKDPDIAAFLRGQNSPGAPNPDQDSITVPVPASREDMDGVEHQHTQLDDDNLMGLDGPLMTNPPSNAPADDEDMNDMLAPPAQLPSKEGLITTTETAPIQSVEMAVDRTDRYWREASGFPTEQEILDAIPAGGIDINFFADWFRNFTCAEERRQELCDLIITLLEESQQGRWVRRAPVAASQSGLQDTTPSTEQVPVQDATILAQTAFPTAEEIRIAIDLNPGSTSYDLLQKFRDRVPAGRRKEWEKLVKENTDEGPSYKKDLKRYPKPRSGNNFQLFNIAVPSATSAFSHSAPWPPCGSDIATNFNLDPQKVDFGYEVDFLAPPDLPLPRKNLAQGDRPIPTPDIDWSSMGDTATRPNNSAERATTPAVRPGSGEDNAIERDKTARPSEIIAGPAKNPDGNLPTPEAIAAAIPLQGIPLDELEVLFSIGPEQKERFWSLFEQVARHIEWSNWCFRLPPFPTGREIWEVIPPEDEEGILMEDLLEKFKGRVPRCLRKRFEESVERHAVQLFEDEPEWNQKPRPLWRRDITYGQGAQDSTRMTPPTLLAHPLPYFDTQSSSSPAQPSGLRSYPTADEVYYAIPPSGTTITALKAIFEDRIAGEPSDRFNAILAAVSRKFADSRHRKLSYKPTTLPPAPQSNTRGPQKPAQAITEPSSSDWSNPNTGCRDPNCRMTEEHDCGVWLFSDSEEGLDDEEEDGDLWTEEEFRILEELRRKEFHRKKAAGMLPTPKSRKSRAKTRMPPN